MKIHKISKNKIHKIAEEKAVDNTKNKYTVRSMLNDLSKWDNFLALIGGDNQTPQ